jgi:hypothetical protein
MVTSDCTDGLPIRMSVMNDAEGEKLLLANCWQDNIPSRGGEAEEQVCSALSCFGSYASYLT